MAVLRRRAGVIPACAGSRRCRSGAPARFRGHSRVRGAGRRPLRPGLIEGSSPRARGAGRAHVATPVGAGVILAGWGAEELTEELKHHLGVIPACAGSSPWGCPWGPAPWGHPRVRGGQRASATSRRHGGGHPRVRGEQSPSPSQSSTTMGSSPRARGAARGHLGSVPAGGVIPACAGSRVLQDLDREKREGSSPRARGAGCNCQLLGRQGGVIPACAGSSARRLQRRNPSRGHPRVRGEQAR